MALSVVNWNVQWATPRSERSPKILRRIGQYLPEIVCLTETDYRLLSECGGYVISAQPYWGQSAANNRRKVLLWSRQPWAGADNLGSKALPPGRFIAGVTETSAGPVRAIGVCIPWSHSRTERFGGDRQAWQDHDDYLGGLTSLLARTVNRRTIILGDFNQPIAQHSNVPADLRAKLLCAVPPRMTIATTGLGHRGKRTIDHIVLGEDLTAESLGVISNLRDNGKPLSDHFGIVANLTTRNPAREPSTEE